MVAKNNTGVKSGGPAAVLPSEQLQLALGFEELLAEGATEEGTEAPAPSVGTPVPLTTEAATVEAPDAPAVAVDTASTAGEIVAPEVTSPKVPEIPDLVGPRDPRDTLPSLRQTATDTSPSAPIYWTRTEGDGPKDPNAISDSTTLPNGGIEERAMRMVDDVSNGSIYIGGTTAKAADTSTVKSMLNNAGALEVDVDAPKLTPNFTKVMSYVVEDYLSQVAFGKNEEGQYDREDQITDEQLMGDSAFSKADGNRRLGQEIHRQHQRYINNLANQPTDAYTDLSPDEAYLLGDMAKELYYETQNKNFGEGVFMTKGRDVNAKGEQAMFQLTPAGQSLIRQGNTLRKKLLPKTHVRPLKVPPPDGRLMGEIGRIVRNVTSRVYGPGSGVSSRELNEAMRNLSQTAHVVDPQRLKILLSTGLAALTGSVPMDHPFAYINHIGKDKMDEFLAREQTATDQNRKFIPKPMKSYEAIQNDLAQALYGISLDRKGPNYLTFYLQAASGRIAVQQTNFDPTTKKSVRFVTRSATPTQIKKGSKYEKALRQMYAMSLLGPVVKDADALLPDAREQALKSAENTLYDKGVRLRNALAEISDAQVEAVADAIAKGVPLDSPDFPKMPMLGLDPNNKTDADLLAEIKKKGEDGQAYIDGLIDFANYKEAMDSGNVYQSYFNAYIDGKTNGLAANGMQMGDEATAYRTGVLRRGIDDFFIDGNEDIRDLLDSTLNTLMDFSEFELYPSEDYPEVYRIAKKIYSNRGLNKTTSMTFGYGKDVEGFKADILEFMNIMRREDGQDAKDLNQDIEILLSKGSSMGDLIDSIHSKYDAALREVLGPDTMESRNLMRGAAFLHQITNELFSIKGPAGSMLNMGGMMSTGAQGKGTPTKIFVNQRAEDVNESYRKKTAPVSQIYGEEATAAAPKVRTDPITGEQTTEIGGTSWGAAIPIPIQSIDAATVALSASGKSWKDIRERSQQPKNSPYMFPIYDAFKMDASTYDAVLQNVNDNWIDINFKWSYLKQTQNSLNVLKEKTNELYKDLKKPLVGNDRAMIDYLFSTFISENQKPVLQIVNKLGKVMDPRLDQEDIFNQVDKLQSRMRTAGFRGFKKEGNLWVIDPNVPLTVNDLKVFNKSLESVMNLDSRLQSHIDNVETKRSKLKAKIKAAIARGELVLQYYTH